MRLAGTLIVYAAAMAVASYAGANGVWSATVVALVLLAEHRLARRRALHAFAKREEIDARR